MEEDQPIDVHREWEIVRLMQPCDSMHVSLSPLPEGGSYTCAHSQIQDFLGVDFLALIILQTTNLM